MNDEPADIAEQDAIAGTELDGEAGSGVNDLEDLRQNPVFTRLRVDRSLVVCEQDLGLSRRRGPARGQRQGCRKGEAHRPPTGDWPPAVPGSHELLELSHHERPPDLYVLADEQKLSSPTEDRVLGDAEPEPHCHLEAQASSRTAVSIAAEKASISPSVVNTFGVTRMHENSSGTNRGRTWIWCFSSR